MSENESIEERRGSERQDGQFPCQVVINEVAYEVTRNLSLGGVLFTQTAIFQTLSWTKRDGDGGHW